MAARATAIDQKQEMLLSAAPLIHNMYVYTNIHHLERQQWENSLLHRCREMHRAAFVLPGVVKFLFHKKATKGNLTYIMAAAQHP